MALAGGAPLVVCQVPPVTRGGAWAPDGWIYFGIENGGLQRVRSSGGNVETFTTPDRKAGERAHVWPQVLPGGSQLLVVVRAGKDFQEYERSNLAVLDIASRKLRVVLQGVSFGRFAPPGHLIFVRGASVLAAPRDPRTLEPSGPHFALPGDVDGRRRRPSALPGDRSRPARVRRGRIGARLDGHPGLGGPRRPRGAAPAGAGELPRSDALARWKDRRARRREGARESIYTYDFARNVLSPLLPEAGRSFNPTWTPDSRRIFFSSFETGWPRLYSKAADGSGAPEAISPGEVPEFPSSVSPDGRTLAYAAVSGEIEATDIWLLGLDGKRERRAWFETPFKEYGPFFSPDGSLIAYTAEESGEKPEVYVRPYPGPGGRIKISGSDGGSEPLWSPDGNELFYRTVSEQLMSTTIVRSPTLSASAPRFVLNTAPYMSSAAEDYPRQYAISPDGKRFLFVKQGETKRQSVTQLQLVTDWPAVFGRRP